MKFQNEALKQAARDYLAALEADANDENVARENAAKAKDHLAAVAVLWAQAEVIEQCAACCEHVAKKSSGQSAPSMRQFTIAELKLIHSCLRAKLGIRILLGSPQTDDDKIVQRLITDIEMGVNGASTPRRC